MSAVWLQARAHLPGGQDGGHGDHAVFQGSGHVLQAAQDEGVLHVLEGKEGEVDAVPFAVDVVQQVLKSGFLAGLHAEGHHSLLLLLHLCATWNQVRRTHPQQTGDVVHAITASMPWLDCCV